MNHKLSLIIAVLILISFSAIAQTTISKEDRKKVLKELKESQKELEKAVKGLSEEQLNYKASEDSWSVANCVEHLAIAETSFQGLLYASLKEDADPSKRKEVNFGDDELLTMIQDRSNKVKTPEPFEPSGKFGGYPGALETFNAKRNENIDFIKNTQEDLRNHYYDFPFGKVDSYQILIFVSAHNRRHLGQIMEVKANDSYPAE